MADRSGFKQGKNEGQQPHKTRTKSKASEGQEREPGPGEVGLRKWEVEREREMFVGHAFRSTTPATTFCTERNFW